MRKVGDSLTLACLTTILSSTNGARGFTSFVIVTSVCRRQLSSSSSSSSCCRHRCRRSRSRAMYSTAEQHFIRLFVSVSADKSRIRAGFLFFSFNGQVAKMPAKRSFDGRAERKLVSRDHQSVTEILFALGHPRLTDLQSIELTPLPFSPPFVSCLRSVEDSIKLTLRTASNLISRRRNLAIKSFAI